MWRNRRHLARHWMDKLRVSRVKTSSLSWRIFCWLCIAFRKVVSVELLMKKSFYLLICRFLDDWHFSVMIPVKIQSLELFSVCFNLKVVEEGWLNAFTKSICLFFLMHKHWMKCSFWPFLYSITFWIIVMAKTFNLMIIFLSVCRLSLFSLINL